MITESSAVRGSTASIRRQGLREAKGLIQEQLAERIGRSVDTVGNIERGVNATRIEIAYQIAAELGMRLPDLFDFQPVSAASPPIDGPATMTLCELLGACDDDTTVKLLHLVRVGLALASRV